MNGPSAQERGVALEERLLRLFESRGYEAFRNVRLAGRSGVEHQIDVLARREEPLHSSMLIVEAKSQEAPVDKDRVMKLIQIVDDLGADRGILATTSHFTSSAIKTADGHSIDLWDHQKLAQLLGEIEVASVVSGVAREIAVAERSVAPLIPVETIREGVEKDLAKRSRGFLGVGGVNEEVQFCELVYYPYYEIDLEQHRTEKQRLGLFKTETVQTIVTMSISVDAPTGCVVFPTPAGISYAHAFASNLSPDEIAVMRAVGGQQFNYASLAFLGLSEARLRRAISNLLSGGCAVQTNARPRTFRVTRQLPGLSGLASITQDLTVVEGLEVKGARLEIAIKEAASVKRAIESYWPFTTVRSIRMVRYPYVLVQLRAADGRRRVQYIDAIVGNVNEALSASTRSLEVELPGNATQVLEGSSSNDESATPD